MADIYAGLAIILAMSLCMFYLAAWVVRFSPRRVCHGLAMMTVVGIVVYIRFIWYNVHLAQLLPFSNLIVIGNWLPLAAAFFAGLAWRVIPGGVVRRSIPVFALGLTGAFTAVCPLLGSPPRCGNEWSNYGICVQTTKHTCSAACAATLLKLYGIHATEQEMARLCFTRRGTTWMGLYRGLKRKTVDTRWDVEVVACDADELYRMDSAPMILTVGWHHDSNTDPATDAAFREERGWIPGTDHSVILLDFLKGGAVQIADPVEGIGREYWTKEELRMLWQGQAVRLVKRTSH